MALYLSEFVLLHLHFLTLKPSHMAAAIVLLATILTEENSEWQWPLVVWHISQQLAVGGWVSVWFGVHVSWYVCLAHSSCRAQPLAATSHQYCWLHIC